MVESQVPASAGVPDPLAGLDDVDWGGLRHAYGAAAEVPAMLRALVDPTTCVQALDKLDAAIYHQGGGVYPAAAAAVPFLIRLVTEVGTPGRADLVVLLTRFAALVNTLRDAGRMSAAAGSCAETLDADFDGFLALLDDPNEAVRRAALELLVELQAHGDAVAADLMRRHPGEPDQAARVRYLLAVGDLGQRGALSAAVRAEAAQWLGSCDGGTADPLHLGVLVARHRLSETDIDPSKLVEALYHPTTDPALYRPGVTHSAGLVGWLGAEIGDQRPGRVLLARRLLAGPVPPSAAAALSEVGVVMMTWRSATSELVPQLAQLLADPSDKVRAAALHLLAAAGEVSRPYGDQIAATITEPQSPVTANAVWALARLGDARAVPRVDGALHNRPALFDVARSHYSDTFYWLTQRPGLADVLQPLAPHASQLIPAIRWRLARDQSTPTVHSLTETLAKYGPLAAEALPELAALLDTPAARSACHVIGTLAVTSRPVTRKLRRLANQADDTGRAAAWALYRVTGDPQPVLASLDLTTTRHDAARRLGDLGPHAAGHAPAIAERLTRHPEHWATWEGVELAYTHWRLTNDPTLCLNVFDAALDPLRHGRQLPVTRQALRYLPTLAAHAGHLQPLLQDVVSRDKRLRYSGGWRALAEDDQARTLATTALHTITTAVQK